MVTNRLWTKEEDAQLLKLKGEGSSLSEIAIALGRSIGAINTRLVATHGFRVRKEYKKKTIHCSREGRRVWTEEESALLREWFAAGFSPAEIAKELGRNESFVTSQYNLLKKSGDELPKVPTPYKPGASGGSGKPAPSEPSQAELLREVIATQKQHTKLLEKLALEIFEVKDFVKASTANAQLVKLNRIINMLAAEHTPLNKLGAGEKLVMIPDDGDFSTVVKSDRVIIKRVE